MRRTPTPTSPPDDGPGGTGPKLPGFGESRETKYNRPHHKPPQQPHRGRKGQNDMKTTVYTIKKARIEAWGYEITAKNFHNIAPSVEAAIDYLQGRFGHDVKIRIKTPA